MSDEPPPRPRGLIVKPPVMAAIVGLTERRLLQLSNEGMPKAGRDGYPLANVVQWLIDYWRKRATQTPLGEARRRKAEADASTAEIDLDLKKASVADVATMARAHGLACAQLRTRLLAIPSKAAARVHRMRTLAEIEGEIRREIIEALEELSGGAAAKD